VEETSTRVNMTLSCLKSFKAAYEDHRGRLQEFVKGDSSGRMVKKWEFAPQIVFHRFDRILARVVIIKVRTLNNYPSENFSKIIQVRISINNNSGENFDLPRNL